MNYKTRLIGGLVFSLIFSHAFAAKTKLDLTITEQDIISAGIMDLARVRSDLGLSDKEQNFLIQHVVTPGENQATKEYLLLDIKTLEKITPKFQAYNVVDTGVQLPLSDSQLSSLIKLLPNDKSNVDRFPTWLTDKNQKKYINIILKTTGIHGSKEGKISALSTEDASILVDWAIKRNRLYREDHPATESKMTLDIDE